VDTTVKDPLVGRVLDGRYHVVSRLARGGMATVYEAVDSRLDRTVALKVMHPGLAEDEEFVSRFIREAKSAARLSHPNVVAVYDQGADDGHVFLAMEHVPGRTLRDLLREVGRLNPRQALEIFEPMLAALGAAHQAGIVHRDVKPENVLLSDDGRVKVADFGLARAVANATSHTTSGILMGTVGYLSPEQVERGIADPRSDVYSAGIVLFEMLTGDKPYDGETALQIAYRHVHDDVPPPSTVVRGLPAEMDALVLRATSRNPDQRPADAKRFLTEVVAARLAMSEEELGPIGPPLSALNDLDHTMVVPLGGTPPMGVPRTVARRGDTGPIRTPRKRRRRGPIALLVIVTLAAVLAAAGWYYGLGPGSDVTTPSLLGLTAAHAKDKAQAEGLSVKVGSPAYDETVPVGSVVTTDPKPNDSIDRNGTIVLALSKGPERHDVPTLTGKTPDVAGQILADNHLKVGDPTDAYSDDVAKGMVVETVPPVGTALKRDATVQLVISKGAEPVDVPDVTGKSVDDAKSTLKDVGLRGKVAERKYDEQVADGDVISQAPPDGQLPKGSDVALVVSKGPPLVAVPDVVGMSIGEAIARLHSAGFQTSAFGPGFGTVRGQNPRGGTAPKGSTIKIVYL
jgi:eukaryotic-like serine/threonine-protein kinase